MARLQGTQRPGKTNKQTLWDLLCMSHPSPWIGLCVLVHFHFFGNCHFDSCSFFYRTSRLSEITTLWVGLFGCLIQMSTPLMVCSPICETRIGDAVLIPLCNSRSFCSALCPKKLVCLHCFVWIFLLACLLYPMGSTSRRS